MELSKRTKIIVLGAVLLILLLGGTGLVTSLLNNKDDKEAAGHQTEVQVESQTEPPYTLQSESESEKIASTIAPAPEGMEVKYIQNDLSTLPQIGRFSGEFLNYKGKSVLYYDKKLMDLATKETILELPESIFADYVWGVYVDDADQIYTISSKEAPGTLFFSQYTSKGEIVGEPVELKDNAVKWFQGKDGDDENFVRLWYFSVDKERIYLTTWSLDSIFQMFSRDGTLLFTQNTCYGTVLDQGNLYLTGRLGESTAADFGVGLLAPATLEWQYVTGMNQYAFGLELDLANRILYAPTETGVNTYSAVDGKPLGEVFQRYKDGEMVTSGSNLRGFAMDQNGNLYFRSWERKDDIHVANQYLRYDRTLVEKEEQKVTLTIYDNLRSEYVEELILRFEAKYPEEKVEYSYENENIKAALKPSYHEKLAETLLAGDAADIVMVGGYLTVSTDMMKSGLLEDLTPYLEEDFDRTAYDETILSALKQNGEIKAFPINFYVPYLQIDEKGLRELGVTKDFEKMTWSEWFSLVDVVKEKTPDKALFAVQSSSGFKENTMEQIFLELLVTNLPELIDYETGTVDLNQQWFVDLLKQLKAVSDHPNIAKYVPFGKSHPDDPLDYLRNQSYIRFNVGSDFYYTPGTRKTYEHYYPNQKPDSDVRYYPVPSGEKNTNRAFYSWSLYGITSKSEHKETAWKFLKFAIEEENQKLGSLMSLPVNKKAWSAMIPPSDTVPEEGVEKFFTDLTMLYRDIDTVYGADKVTMDVFYPLLEYLNDEATLDEALAKAQQNAWIRINE